MKLKKECIRDLLLFVESSNTPSVNESEIQNFIDNTDYTKPDIIYTIQKLQEAGYLNANIKYGDNTVYWYSISSITYDGHQFLDTIRDDSVWEAAKQKTSVLKDVSINIISQVAVAYVKSQLGL